MPALNFRAEFADAVEPDMAERTHEPLTRLDTIIGGRHVVYTVGKRYSRRGVIGLARKLLRNESQED